MTFEPEGSKAQSRFAWLDLMRIACAVAVMLFHFGYVAPVANAEVPGSYALWPSISVYGRLGVPLFFMISGFVIAISADGRGWRDFLWARMVRLYPAYWLTVPATAIVLVLTQSARAPGLGQTMINMTMLQSFVGVAHVDPVYHTLAVELRFYVMVTILLLVRVRVTSLAVLVGWTTLSAASLLLPTIIGKLLIASFAPYFLTGMVIRAMVRPGRRWVYAALLIVLLCLEARLIATGANIDGGQIDGRVHFAIVLAGTALILACAFAPNPRRVGLLAALGAMTYPLYLIHSEAGMALMRVCAPWMPASLGVWPMVLLMLLIAFGISRYPEPALRKSSEGLRRSLSERMHGRRVIP